MMGRYRGSLHRLSTPVSLVPRSRQSRPRLGPRRPAAPVRSGLEVECDGRIGFEDPEAEALLDVEPHDIGVMVEIADGQVLPTIELEIPTSKTDHDANVDAGRPHQGPTEDLPKVVEEQMPPVFGALDDPRVDVWTDG